ncbi:SagB/ThcOx family dehydrogenase [Amycolatopsis sp. NPDC054798]
MSFRKTFLVNGNRLLTRVGPADAPAGGAAFAGKARLSPEVLLRVEDGEWLVESSRSPWRVVLHDHRLIQLVGLLSTGRTAGDLVSDLLSPELVETVLGVLHEAGFLSPDAVLATPPGPRWEVHDRYFHARSRGGCTPDHVGGTFRGSLGRTPLPASKSPLPGERIPLARPTWEAMAREDPTLAVAMEARTSVRGKAPVPLSADEIGEFLYRVARIRSRQPEPTGPGLGYARSDRPFPSGGATYELEIYLTVARCRGLDPGSYHYDAAEHVLRPIDADPDDRSALLHVARSATGGQADPDVLFTIAARFGRVTWKYESMAYALTLKHVGVLYQTMYLVATAMRLSPCALGSGDSVVAAQALQLDPIKEPTVGEFLLSGSPAAAPEARRGDEWEPAQDLQWKEAALQALWSPPVAG